MTATVEAATTEPPVVESYVQDSWWSPAAESRFTTVLDASTEAPVARVSTDGLDVAAAVEHARTVGQRSLRELTIHERALKLKELALYLTEHKQELYDLSFRTGATKLDNMIDVDGGIGVLFAFSGKGRRELPNADVIIDGPTEVLSKDGSFLGTHIYTPLPGVAAQINAFNFPVWGMLEKFAPAFVAGVPTIVKPATPTGYVTAACVRLMVDSGILPAGSIQLLSGSARDLLDHLDHRDSVAFTGSAATADKLRSHPNVARGGVRFTAEADSLNCAILGPDAVSGTPEFDAYVKSLVTEMTAKAGQKCTSIRRAIVPSGQVDAVVSAVAARLRERVTVGDPRAEGTTMGALASLDQRDDVRSAVQQLVDGGGRVAIGEVGGATGETTLDGSTDGGSVSGGSGVGAFLDPVLLTWADPNAAALHSIEAFGPVSSVVGYDDLDDAIRLAARGGGSLVATVCTNDPDAARALVTGIAAHHGRVLILNREDAKSSTGHGSPVPQLIHGGPGRAGGGEELGGIRAVKHQMQRTALQGSPNMLTAVTGVWHTGADRQLAGSARFGGDPELTHPFRKSVAQLRIGDAYVSDLREVRLEDIAAFATDTGDTFYAHTDDAAAAANPFFPGIVAHGYLLVSWAAGLFVSPDPGPVLANYGLERLRFVTPVPAGDSIRVTLTAKSITPRVSDEYGEVCWDAVIQNQDDDIVATYDVLTLVAKEWPAP